MKGKVMIVLAATIFTAQSQAQLAVGPFAGVLNERFDTIAPGSYAGFGGFSGYAGIMKLGGAGGLLVNNIAGILPPLSAPNDMFGRGTNVRISFQNVWRKFGGWFRVPNTGVVVTQAKFRFLRNGMPVGAIVTRPVWNGGWVWAGWDLTTWGGFNALEIYGNGLTMGYVGMDNLVVRN